MRNSGSLIALLLVMAILFLPYANSPAPSNVQVSPQAVCGDTVSDTLPHDDDSTAKIIVIVVIVIIVIIIIGSIANTETG